jgi:hypothetical protein
VREESLEDPELCVYVLGGHAGSSRSLFGDRREASEARGDKFGVFRGATHEDGAKDVFFIPAICSDEVRVGTTESHRKRSRLTRPPCAALTEQKK